MPDEKPKVEAKDWGLALKILNETETHALSFSGKPGMNPHIYIKKEIYPLRTAFEAGNKSDDLFNKIISLKKVEPKAPESTLRKTPK